MASKSNSSKFSHKDEDERLLDLYDQLASQWALEVEARRKRAKT